MTESIALGFCIGLWLSLAVHHVIHKYHVNRLRSGTGRTQFVLHSKHLCPLTCLFNKQWKMNIISPCKELVMANRYLKATVDELKFRSPNSHVIPSKGRMTAEALTPAFTFSICVLFCTCLVPIIWRITRMNITTFICVKEEFVGLNGDVKK